VFPTRVTVVVPTRERALLVVDTVKALLSLDYRHLDILVVDQSDTDATRRAVGALAAGDGRVSVIRAAPNGSAGARNRGAAESRAPIVAYIDDDCIVDGAWLAGLLAEFADPDVAAVYGRLLPYGFSRRTGREVGFKASLRRVVYTGCTPPWYIGHGGNMAFRRADLLAVGGFDLLLGAGATFGAGEDGDIAYRLLRAGKRVVYAPKALAYHKHWKDWPTQQLMERAYGVGVGAQLAKYIRGGDVCGAQLLILWVWQLGIRRIAAGLLKWRDPKNVYLGYCQIVYPWVGIWRSRAYRIDPERGVYVQR